ncbi:hypothetical protein Mapa_003987 [Marchantia paleacea]|nr:hypothetical protein Mapa_003987 [Marchantia paleacea]
MARSIELHFSCLGFRSSPDQVKIYSIICFREFSLTSLLMLGKIFVAWYSVNATL